MSNETVVEKIPFDILEVGCKYESRCGEVWEVTGIADDQSPLTHNASNLDDEGVYSIFTETGKFWSSISSPHDLVFKLVDCSSEQPRELSDAINPSHYKHNGIETIDYMKAVSTGEEFKGHLRLTAIKYISRLGKKDCPKQEIKKAIWYLNKLLEEYEAENNE